MKRLLLLSVFALFLFTTSWAYNFSVKNDDGVTIYYDVSGVEVTVTNSSSYYPTSTYNSYSGDVVIPAKVTWGSFSYSVTSIGNSAFRDCTGLTSVTIPESVTSIGKYAFQGCTALTEVTIPNSVTSIGNYAFRDCSGLTEITIGESVTEIGSQAFRDCSGLKQFLVDEGNEYYCAKDGVLYSKDMTTLVLFPLSSPLLPSFDILDGVTSIDSYAFYGCTGLTSITIPESVTSIGNIAFQYCTGLAEVNFNAIACTSAGTSSSNYAFYGCTNISKMNFGDNVTIILAYLCYGCSELTSITIPESVTTIGERAFCGCSGLTTLTLENGEETLSMTTRVSSYTPFTGCPIETLYLGRDISYNDTYSPFENNTTLTTLTIGEKVTHIPSYEFFGCTGLTSVTIPESVTSIGNSAFQGCTGLTEVNFNAIACTSAGSSTSGAFNGCINISTMNFGNNVTVISDNLCYKLTNLTEIDIPENVTSIGNYAFYDCTGLTEVTIPNSVTTIGNYAFYGCNGLYGNLTIPDRVTEIGGYAFYECSGLTGIAIPNNVTSIGQYAFYGCKGLTKITIPNSVTSIGQYAFAYCTGLTDVTIGENVTTIGSSAFNGCEGLLKIYVNNSTPPSITSTTFSGVDKDACILYVPVGSTGVYRLDNYWGEFYNITRFDFTGVDDISNNGVTIGSENDAILVKGENVPVSVYDTGGRLLYHKDDCDNESIALPSGKIYIVKAGEQVRKVITK